MNDQRDLCGASMPGVILNKALGPCILRADHDGPIHQDASGAQWGAIDNTNWEIVAKAHEFEAKQLRERTEQAEAAIERVRAVHRPKAAKRVQPCDTHPPQTVCSSCEVTDVTVCSHPGCHGWPCDTIAAVDPPEET